MFLDSVFAMVFELTDVEVDVCEVSKLEPVHPRIRTSPVTLDVLQLFIDLQSVLHGQAGREI